MKLTAKAPKPSLRGSPVHVQQKGLAKGGRAPRRATSRAKEATPTEVTPTAPAMDQHLGAKPQPPRSGKRRGLILHHDVEDPGSDKRSAGRVKERVQGLQIMGPSPPVRGPMGGRHRTARGVAKAAMELRALRTLL